MDLTQASKDTDLNCPVCLEVFNDPCFVCHNHHTMCRACYLAIANNPGSQCPQCHERLQKPVENSLMRRFVEASNPRHSTVTRSGTDSRNQQRLAAKARATMETCTVQIFNVQFNETCQSLKNPDLDDTKCYVVFELPGFPNEETETPVSLPTPRPGHSLSKDFNLTYNFKRPYDYSFGSSYEKRKMLAILLLQKEHIQITFTVVCETTDPDSEFYIDIGQAIVNLESKIARGSDICEESFPLMLNEDHVGSIKISTNLPTLLNEVYNELPDSKKKSVKFMMKYQT